MPPRGAYRRCDGPGFSCRGSRLLAIAARELCRLHGSGIQSVVDAASSGDAILTLGAGSVSRAGDEIIEKLRSRS
jgi:hypothetical protein